jgi:hypothetical protein
MATCVPVSKNTLIAMNFQGFMSNSGKQAWVIFYPHKNQSLWNGATCSGCVQWVVNNPAGYL